MTSTRTVAQHLSLVLSLRHHGHHAANYHTIWRPLASVKIAENAAAVQFCSAENATNDSRMTSHRIPSSVINREIPQLELVVLVVQNSFFSAIVRVDLW